MLTSTFVLEIAGWVALITLVVLVVWITVEKVRLRIHKEPRILVSQQSIPVGDRHTDAPCGLKVINGIKVREKDIVILFRQNVPSSNGVWVVNSGSWERPHDNHLNTAGAWKVSSNGELWVRSTMSGSEWGWIPPTQKVLAFTDSNIAPSCPAEAAAFLFRLGVNPRQIRFSRPNCINTLVEGGFITRAQGDLLLAKPENLTTHTLDGLAQLNDQTWVGQVVAYMGGIRSVNESLGAQLQAEYVQPQFTTQEVVGFKKINQVPTLPPEGKPPRRSRYDRDPVI